MRYPIATVLRGYEQYQADTLKGLEDEVTRVQAELEGWQRDAEGQRRNIARKLGDQSDMVFNPSTPITGRLLTEILEGLKPYFTSVPAEHDIQRNGRELKAALRRLEDHRQAEESHLIRFLRAMKSVGESYTSSHAIREAGFRPAELSQYVLAADKK